MFRPQVASHDQKPNRGIVSGIKSPPLARTPPPPPPYGIYIDRCIITPFVISWPDVVTFYAQKLIFSDNRLGTLHNPFNSPWKFCGKTLLKLQSQSEWLGHFGVSLSPQCWCTRFGDRTAINNFERDEGSTRREKTAFG